MAQLEPTTPQAALASLPDEIWSQCFTSLDYFDLRRIEMVCKRFQAILKVRHDSVRAVRSGSEELITRGTTRQDSPFDAKLFRKGPGSDPLKPGQAIDLHPLLEQVNPVMSGPGEAMCGFRQVEKAGPAPESEVINAYESPAIKEYATSPACQFLDLEFLGATDPISNEGGVTVEQVVTAAIDALEEPVYGDVADWLRRYCDGETNQPVRVRDRLCERNGFTGYYPATVQPDGTISLKTCPFDS